MKKLLFTALLLSSAIGYTAFSQQNSLGTFFDSSWSNEKTKLVSVCTLKNNPNVKMELKVDMVGHAPFILGLMSSNPTRKFTFLPLSQNEYSVEEILPDGNKTANGMFSVLLSTLSIEGKPTLSFTCKKP